MVGWKVGWPVGTYHTLPVEIYFLKLCVKRSCCFLLTMAAFSHIVFHTNIPVEYRAKLVTFKVIDLDKYFLEKTAS